MKFSIDPKDDRGFLFITIFKITIVTFLYPVW
jgi:hypothetical protein